MKRFLVSTVAIALSMGALVGAASASQLALNSEGVDHNNDGVSTLHELVTVNRGLRDKK